jgi:hypothetical protein
LVCLVQYFDNGVASKLNWNSGTPSPRPLTWWRLDFPVIDSSSQSSWAIDLSSMGKGAAPLSFQNMLLFAHSVFGIYFFLKVWLGSTAT